MKFVRIAGLILAATMSVAYANENIEESPNVQALLAGAWRSNCFRLDEGLYLTRTFDFVSAGQASITTLNFSDASCTSKPFASRVIPASWQLGDTLVTAEGLPALQIQFVLIAGFKRELTTVHQVIHLHENAFNLGVNHSLNQFPEHLDWEIVYSRVLK